MPLAQPTLEAKATAVLAARQPKSFVTAREPFVDIDLAGIPGDRHYGLLRKADSRQRIYPRGVLIANRRQLSVVSEEDCALIAAELGIAEVLPEWLGANLLIAGCPSLTLLPPGARLVFPSGAGLIGEGENQPCKAPGEQIALAVGQPELARRFTRAARKLRGIVCSVECAGRIACGDTVRIYLP